MDKIIKKGGNFVLPVKMNNKGANKDTIEKDFNEKVKNKKKVDNLEYMNSYKEKFEVYDVRIDIWTQLMRECIINYVH